MATTRIIEVNRCIECPLRGQIRDEDGIRVQICLHAGTYEYEIPDIDTIPEFCALRVI